VRRAHATGPRLGPPETAPAPRPFAHSPCYFTELEETVQPQDLSLEVKGAPVIPQAVLEEFMRLQAVVQRLRRLRADVRELLRRGAVVEPGRLTAEIRRYRQRRLPAARLTAILGAEVVAQIKQLVPTTDCARLRVGEADQAQGGSAPAPNARPRTQNPTTGANDHRRPLEM
jgi:hypothetical protein